MSLFVNTLQSDGALGGQAQMAPYRLLNAKDVMVLSHKVVYDFVK